MLIMNTTRVAAEREIKSAASARREPKAFYVQVLAAYEARDREEAAMREAARLRRLRAEKARRAASGGAFKKM